MSSQETIDPSQITCLKTLSEKLNPESFKRLTRDQKFLLSVYHRWEAAARDPCGRLFIHQAHKNPSPPTHGSNTPTAI